MKEINHHIWELQYEVNQDKGYKDSINFKDAFLNELFVKKGIIHASLFMNTKFANEALNTNVNNFWIKNDQNLNINDFIPSYSSAPLDEISLQNTISKEYVDLYKGSNSPFTFSIIHLLPLPLKNNDKDNDWIKKIGNDQIRRKLDTWLSNKNPIYLENTLTSFTSQTLMNNGIKNNFDKPIFLISNIEFDQFNKIEIIDYINIYVGVVDEANQIFRWVKISKNFFKNKNRYEFHTLKPVNPLDFDIDNLKKARNINLEYYSFTLYHEYERTQYYNLFSIHKDYVYMGELNQWVLNKKSISTINNTKLPNYLMKLNDFLHKWVIEIENMKKNNL